MCVCVHCSVPVPSCMALGVGVSMKYAGVAEGQWTFCLMHVTYSRLLLFWYQLVFTIELCHGGTLVNMDVIWSAHTHTPVKRFVKHRSY